MSDTTSIDDLPLSSQTPSAGYANNGGGGGGGGAPLIYSPNIDGGNTSHVPGNIMNEVMHGVQRASANGMTMIPTRDIPMNPMDHIQDEQVQPNYIPPPPKLTSDYIQEYQVSQDRQIREYEEKKMRETLSKKNH